MQNFIAIIKKILPFFIVLILIFFLWKNIDFESLILQFKKANPIYIVLSMLVMAFSHILRALRMNMLLDALGHKTSTYTTSLTVFIGYLVNLIVPRMGEITRCTVLQKTNKIPLETSIGAVFSERLIDVLCLFVFLLFGLFIAQDVVLQFLETILKSKANQSSSSGIYFIFAILLATLLCVSFWIYKNLDKLLKIGLFNKIYQIILGFWNGLVGVFKIKNKGLFMVYSISTWICYFILTWLLMLAFEPTSNMGWKVAFITNALGAVGMAAPVQGGIGAYHFMVQQVLGVYGIEFGLGLVCATLLHSTQMFATIIFGTLSSILVYFELNKQKNEINT